MNNADTLSIVCLADINFPFISVFPIFWGYLFKLMVSKLFFTISIFAANSPSLGVNLSSVWTAVWILWSAEPETNALFPLSPNKSA